MKVVQAFMLAQLEACAAEGLSQVETAARLGTWPGRISILAKRHGLKFHHHSRFGQKAADERSTRMAALYRDGRTLEAIGTEYGITRERVRQIITKYHRLTAKKGGQHVVTQRKRSAKAAAADAACFAKHGCSLVQLAQLRRIGRDLMLKGTSRERTPIGAFISQKRNAGVRGIGWELNLWQWWTIWQESGRWQERGRGAGYGMCRVGDCGAYSAANVYIARCIDNLVDSISIRGLHHSGLPVGVRKVPAGGFKAVRIVRGKQITLSLHQTPEAAHAAYLAAVTPNRAAA